MTYSDTRANLKAVMERVVADSEPVVITRQRGRPVVMISLDDWNSIMETAHLNSTAANRKRLDESIAQLDAGKGVERDLIHP